MVERVCLGSFKKGGISYKNGFLSLTRKITIEASKGETQGRRTRTPNQKSPINRSRGYAISDCDQQSASAIGVGVCQGIDEEPRVVAIAYAM